jgi:hypothetical protein
VRDSKKKDWTPPRVHRFGSAEEVWEHYRSRCTPDERARLEALLERYRRPGKDEKARRAS